MLYERMLGFVFFKKGKFKQTFFFSFSRVLAAFLLSKIHQILQTI